MATILKRNGKFQVQVRRKGFPVTCRTFHLRSDAIEWARHMETKADRGDLPTSRKALDVIKLRDILNRYLTEVTALKRSADNEAALLKAFLRQPLADLALSKLTTSHFQIYREKRLKKVKNGTANREMSIIKHALDLAEREWGVPIAVNPITKLKKLKVSNARTRRLNDEEYQVLIGNIECCRNPHLISLIKFAVETGMRRGEMLRIEWPDINFQAKTLHIPITKNGHSRVIPLTSKAVQILSALFTSDNAQRPFPISDNAAKLCWQRLLKRCKIDDLHFHDLRHEAISRFFEKGLSVPEVALISGHRDFRMLFRYTHMNAESIAKKLD